MGSFEKFPRITPFLWFDANAEEAVDFYVGVFKNSRRLDALRMSEESRMPKGSVLTVAFELDGQTFTAINGGPMYKFTEAISFVVRCDSQEEVDYYWSKLTAGGNEIQCGWLRDKYGVSWQVVPTVLIDMLHDKDAARAQRVMKAMLQMKKIDIPRLEEAYRQQ